MKTTQKSARKPVASTDDPDRQQVTLRLPRKLYQRLRIYAIKAGTSGQVVAEQAIAAFLDEQGA